MDELTAIRQQIRELQARPWYRDKARHLRNLQDAERLLRNQENSYRRQWWAKAG